MDTGQWSCRTLQRIMLILMYACHSFSQYSEDTCNWIIWDGAEDSRGIRNIQPECLDGNIQWKHPLAAIRIIFTQHHASFELCFIARSSHTTIKISTESDSSLKHLALLTPHASETDGEICIDSIHGNDVVLFVENIWSETTTIGFLDIDYSIRKTVSSMATHVHHIEDCRPCTDEEIKNIICYADFVAKGTIRHTEDKPHRGETEVHLSLNKIYRQSHQVFKRYSNDKSHTENSIQRTGQNMEKDTLEQVQTMQRTVDQSSSKQLRIATHSGTVIVPHACRTKRGVGEFVFMGNIRLKRAHLTCAPRTEDFERLWMEASRHGENACVLG